MGGVLVEPDDQARAEVEANLNRPALRLSTPAAEREREDRITQLEAEVRFYRGVYEGQGRINEERLTLLEDREAVGHQMLDNYGAPTLDTFTGGILNINGRMQDLIEILIAQREEVKRQLLDEVGYRQDANKAQWAAERQVTDLQEQLDGVTRERDSLDYAYRTWKQRFEVEVRAAYDLAKHLSNEIERSSLLEMVVKRYASHVWNDLKRTLEDL